MATEQQLATARERFLQLARQFGCPPDQIRNFRQSGYLPQPRQLQFHAAARAADLPDGPTEIGYGGARGGGKSHCTFAQVALDDCQRRQGLKCLYLRKVGKSGRESFEDLRAQILTQVPHNYSAHRGICTFDNESFIILGHFQNESDIDTYLGLQYDVIAVEEATTLSLSKYKAIRTTNRTARTDWRPRIYSNTNPGNIGHEWYKKRFIEPYRKVAEGRTRFVPATVDDNAFVNQEYRETLDDLVGWMLRAWRYGDWDIAAGQFFVNFSHVRHITEPFRVPGDWRFWLAMDYGFAHYTVILLLAESNDGVLYCVDEHAEREWLVPQHVQAVDAMLHRNSIERRHLETFVAGSDVFARRGTELTIAEQYAQAGLPLEPAAMDRINGAAEVMKRLGNADRDIPPTLFIFNRCPRVAESLSAMVHDPGRPEDVLKVNCDEEGEGGDDGYDALRYGVMVTSSRLEYGASGLGGYRG